MFRLLALCLALLPCAGLQAEPSGSNRSGPDLGPRFRLACWNGDLTRVKALFAQGAPLEGTDALGRTPLLLACHGDPDVVKYLLSRGARIDVRENDGDTPLAHACEHGDLASARLLLDLGADVSTTNQYGRTPLILAAREGHDELVSLLLSHQANVNTSGPGGTALTYAVWQDHLSTANLLLDSGADVKIRPTGPYDPKNLPTTTLALAVKTSDVPLIDLLLQHGANINEADQGGVTPLLTALWFAKPPAILHLLERKADANSAGPDGCTPLIAATEYDDVSILEALLQHGAHINDVDRKGRTALMTACRYEHSAKVKYLVEQGAKIDLVDAQGETALTFAANRGRIENVQFLQDHSVKPQAFHIIDQDLPTAPLPPARAFALAVGAIYTLDNGDNLHLLGGDDTKERSQEMLREGWSIVDAGSLLKELEDLRTNGHHQTFQREGAELAALTPAQFAARLTSNPLESSSLTAMLDSYQKWHQLSGLAWDSCRAANLVNAGFTAGYINETDAWDQLAKIARLVQANFKSWREMDENFLDGRAIWAERRDPEFEACSKLLLNPDDPKSPWNQIPWQTDLGPEPVPASH